MSIIYRVNESQFEKILESQNNDINGKNITTEPSTDAAKNVELVEEDDITYNFTEEDLGACWDYYKQYLLDILNGTYKVEDAREDLKSLIGSKYDKRVNEK